MSFRIEDKYKLNQIDYLKFKSFLFAKNFKKKFQERLINSLYFDNKSLSMFHDSEEGTVPRKKLRIRTYNINQNDFFLEKKINSAEGKFKTSKKILKYEYEKYCKFGKFDTTYGSCMPKIFVSYFREYLSNNKVRITIDKKIKYSSFQGNSLFEENFFIVEIKSNIFTSYSELENIFPLNKIRFSKYSEGINKIFSIKQNNRVFA